VGGEGHRLMTDLSIESDAIQALFDAMPVALAQFDAAQRLVRSNNRYAELTNLTAKEINGRQLADAWPNALTGLTDQVAAAMASGHAESRLIEFRTPGGSRMAEVTIARVSTDDGCWLLAGVDVTEREELRRVEQLERLVEERSRQLLALREDRERERRLAAVGQLAAGVMHDVNNVLNPILAAAYLIESLVGDDAAVKEYARRIAHGAEMGVSSLTRLRQFIRQEPHNEATEELVDLAQAVDEVIALAAPLWDGRPAHALVAIDRELASGAVIRGLPGELRAAVLNLVHNALDAMPAGGTLTMVSRVGDGSAVLEVHDTGIGMMPDVKEHAFEPFFSTKGPRGTGLGLAEVYGIVRRHRGVAEIESEPGAGTVVRMRFPLATTIA
jgi:PAS domain S-box-containing protein